MSKFKKTILMLYLTLLGMFCYASGVYGTENERDGRPVSIELTESTGLNFGADTEGLRNFFQNGVHDMKSVASPRFRDLRGTPEYEAMGGDKFYFQFGYYHIW